MTDFLHDPLLALFIAVLAVVVPIVIHARENPRKELSFRVLHSKKIKPTSITTHLGSVTKVLSKNSRVRKGVYEIEIKIRNTGCASLERNHFGSPVTINFGRYASILDAVVAKAKPVYVTVDCSQDGRSVQILPALLNRGNWLKVKILVQDPSYIEVEAHVIGIRRIYSTEDLFSIDAAKFALIGLLLIVIGSVSYSLLGPDPNIIATSGPSMMLITGVTPSLLAIIISIVGGYLLMFAGMNVTTALLFAVWSGVRNRLFVKQSS